MSTLAKRIFPVVISLMVVSLALGFGGYVHAAATPTPTPAHTLSAIQLTQTAQAAQATAIQKALAATATPTPAPTSTPTKAALPEQIMTLIPVVESPHPYPNYYGESWLISNLDTQAEATRLHFARLELEENVDWLIVMDAYDVEVQRITGSYPEGLWTEPVPGNLIRIRLVTDGSVRRWGFAADGVESVPYKTLAYSSHPYPNNANLEWRFDNLDPNAEGYTPSLLPHRAGGERGLAGDHGHHGDAVSVDHRQPPQRAVDHRCAGQRGCRAADQRRLSPEVGV